MGQHKALTAYKNELFNYVNSDFEIKLLNGSCSFSEGPVWSKNGYYLFSDIPENCVYKWSSHQGREIFLSDSGCTSLEMEILSQQIGSNGLAFDENGDLLICQHGNGAIARLKNDIVETLIPFHLSKRFNSPNDIVVHQDGSVFFSDPPYGLKDKKLNPEFCQPVAGFYCWRNGELTLFCDQYKYPNGVCLSPDHEVLYTCSNKPDEAIVTAFDATTLNFQKIICRENSDGIKCDRHGNLYLANKDGILIIGLDGERMGLITLPTVPANLCWGGMEGNDLFITARENIFLIPGLQK